MGSDRKLRNDEEVVERVGMVQEGKLYLRKPTGEKVRLKLGDPIYPDDRIMGEGKVSVDGGGVMDIREGDLFSLGERIKEKPSSVMGVGKVEVREDVVGKRKGELSVDEKIAEAGRELKRADDFLREIKGGEPKKEPAKVPLVEEKRGLWKWLVEDVLGMGKKEEGEEGRVFSANKKMKRDVIEELEEREGKKELE